MAASVCTGGAWDFCRTPVPMRGEGCAPPQRMKSPLGCREVCVAGLCKDLGTAGHRTPRCATSLVHLWIVPFPVCKSWLLSNSRVTLQSLPPSGMVGTSTFRVTPAVPKQRYCACLTRGVAVGPHNGVRHAVYVVHRRAGGSSSAMHSRPLATPTLALVATAHSQW